MTQLKQNTTDLDALIAKSNALPDAGTSEDLTAVLDAQEQLITELEVELEGKASGSGGGSVETCTVVIECTESSYGKYVLYGYAAITNEGFSTNVFEDYAARTVTIANVRLNTMLTLVFANLTSNGASVFINGANITNQESPRFDYFYAVDTVTLYVTGKQDDIITIRTVPDEIVGV